MIAAVGKNGIEFVVWGIGENREEAEEDARGYTHDAYPRPRLVFVEIDEEQRANVVAGNVSCQRLGIKLDRLDKLELL